MKINYFGVASAAPLFRSLFLLGVLTLVSTACDRDNFGPYDETTASFAITNFDRLEMGSAYKITVTQGAAFRISAQGHRRDMDDLNVRRVGSLLKIDYRNHYRNRRHEMNLTITMPMLRAAQFSGASDSRVGGFSEQDLDLGLSGASRLDFTGQAKRLTVNLSGASTATLNGQTVRLLADLSGASRLDATRFPAEEVSVEASGASQARVNATSHLIVDASGASSVRYRGNPTLESHTSGASTVQRD